MIELPNNMDFDLFLPDSWYKKRDGEGNVDWLKRVAKNDSKWLEERKNNRYWKDASVDFCLSVLFAIRDLGISKEKMENDLGMEIDLSSKYDFRLSEMEKIKQYLKM